MEKRRISYLVERLRNGKATPDEQQELEDLWTTNQDDSSFQMLPENERENIRLTIMAAVWSKIASIETNSKRRYLSFTAWPLKVAAVFALIAISFLLFRNSTNPVTLYSAYGEVKNLTLPDGSNVILNGNSSIRYEQAWSKSDDREVWIDGEGFFSVTHTSNHQKFIVHTNNSLNVQVLGTKFNVKVRRGNAEVMLEEGKVRLNFENAGVADTVTMKPGDLITILNNKMLRGAASASTYTSWKNNKLYFDKTPLLEVAKILEDTYGFEVIFENRSLAGRMLSGEIESKNGRDILSAIRESLNIQITEEGRRLVFR